MLLQSPRLSPNIGCLSVIMKLMKIRCSNTNTTASLEKLRTFGFLNLFSRDLFRHTAGLYFTDMASLNSNAGDGSNEKCNIFDMRCAYLTKSNTIKDEDIEKDPFKLFIKWFELARLCKEIMEPNAMCLATCTKDGFPSARFVLMKSFSRDGFIFFTNYESRKGKEMAENPNVAAVFYWEPLRKSIRIEGTVTRIPEEECDNYFRSRPHDSKVGACVSQQSSVIPNRQFLDNYYDELEKAYFNKEVPRPKPWGGFSIIPSAMEFWQGQSNRLHDRIRFRKPRSDECPDEVMLHSAEDGWVYERLSP